MQADISLYSKRIQDQFAFVLDLARLITYAANMGYVITTGEGWRSPEQQRIYVNSGRSKTMKSRHGDRLAWDGNFFLDGKPCTAAQITPLGEYWESLSPQNEWGGRWKSIVDGPHFQRNPSR
jgi:hypothetical protein